MPYGAVLLVVLRLAQPGDITSVGTFLILGASGNIKGEIIIVDGGKVFG